MPAFSVTQPTTMETLRQSLALPPDVFRMDELGTPIPAGHAIGSKQSFFPVPEGTDIAADI